MDLSNISYSFDCTWGQEEKLRSLLTFGDSDDPSQRSSYEGEVEHVISDDLFVHLERPSDESCMIKIDLKDSGLKITKLSVVCESRLIELYGKCGEYLRTEDCTFLASVLDRNMYNAQPDVFPTNQIAIKFLGVKDSTWIYGLKLLLKQEGPSSSSYFDYKNIEEMLKYSKTPISEKADRAKKFLQNYANVFTNNPPKAEHQMLIKMLEEQYLSQFTPVGDVGKNMSKYLTNLIPSKLKTNENGASETVNIPSKTNENGASGTVNMNEIKQYVDDSVRQLEERVQNSIAQQFKEFEAKQNEKLDSIIKLLSKS